MDRNTITKKNRLIIVFIIVLMIVILLLFIRNNNKIDIVNENKLQNNNELIIKDSYLIIENNPEDPYTVLNIKYPSFKQADISFNLKIENFVLSQIEEHRNIGKESWIGRFNTLDGNDNQIDNVPTEEEKFGFTFDPIIIQSNKDYISFILRYGGYSGGAHGYENIVSFNYDVKNKKDVSLANLFSFKDDYLKYLSETSGNILTKRFATISEEDKENYSPEILRQYVQSIVSMIEDGTEPKEDNFKVFTFTPEKVKIYFAQYQVGPYVIGMPEVEIDRK
jgi:hypothetical protein